MTTGTAQIVQETRRLQKDKKLAERAQLRQGVLEKDGERQRWFENVQDIIRYIRPDLCEYLESNDYRGEKRGQYMYTSKPTTDAEKAADGFVGNVFQDSGWFKALMAQADLNEYDPIQQWLQDCEKYLHGLYRDSSFSMVQSSLVLDGLTIGDGLLYIEQPKDIGELPYYRKCRILDAYLKRDQHLRLKVVHYLEHWMACEAYERYGDKLSDSAVRAAFHDPFSEVKLVRCVYRRGDPILEDLELEIDRPYIEIMIEKDSPKNSAAAAAQDPDSGILDQQGYFENPFVDWPYWLNDNESYGRSAYGSAIISIKRLHAEHKSMMRTAQKAGDPPLKGTLGLKNNIDRRPGHVSWLPSSGEILEELYRASNSYPFAIEYLQRHEGQLEDVLHLPLYQAMTMATKEMTVPEVLERIGERARILAPRLGSFQYLYLNGVHDRTWQIEQLRRRGPLSRPPAELVEAVRRGAVDGKIEMRYKGPLSEAGELLFLQRRLTINLAMLTALAQVGPEWSQPVMDRVKADVAAEHILDEGGFWRDAIASDEEVAAQQRTRTQLAVAQAQAEIGKARSQGLRNTAAAEQTVQEGQG